MTRLPVGATVRQAYGFASRGFLHNLAIVWLPVVLFATLAVLSVPPLLVAIGHLAQRLASLSGPHPNVIVLATGGAAIMRYAILIGVGGLFFRAQMMTGLTQRALGKKAGLGVVYLSLGATFWRVFGAYVLIFLLLTAVQLAATLLVVIPTIVLVAINHGVASTGTSPLSGMAFVAFFVLWRIALFVVVAYLFIRLTFVVTAVIVADGRFDLIRAWRLAGGNVLRIFAVGLAIFVPLSLVIIAVYAMVLGGDMWTFVHTLAQAPSHGPQRAAAMLHDIAGMVHHLLVQRWFLLLPLALITATLEYGLAAGAGVAGYQSLMSGADQGDVPFQSTPS
jgi:hypothetical protein